MSITAARRHRTARTVGPADLEPPRRGARATAPLPAWIDEHNAWQRTHAGISARTYIKRRRVIESFLAEHPNFLAVTDEQLQAWLDAQPISAASRRTYRTHLRSLYRWARDVAGMDPTATLPPRGGPGTARSVTPYGSGKVLLDVPGPWREPIAAWVTWMLAAARPDSTVYHREWQLRRLAAGLCHLTPAQVTTDDLARFVAGRSWAQETTRNNLAAWRSFFGWAQATGRTQSNPAALLARVRQPHRAARPAPEQVLSDALAQAGPQDRLMLLLAAHLGLRRAEIANLHTDDLREGIHGTHLRILGKGNKERVLPVVGELRELLLSRPRGYVFPGHDNGHLSAPYVGKRMSRLLGPGWTAHTLRHRFATVAYAAQRDLFAVQSLLGHQSPETTRHYVQLPADAAWAAVAAASR